MSAPATAKWIRLERYTTQYPKSGEAFTKGELFVPGVDGRFCYSVEDEVRAEGAAKVYGKTAIPAGQYRVRVTMSARFGKRLPLIEKVLGFSGIRIHGGNRAEDSEGCPCIGQFQTDTGVRGSAPVVAALIKIIDDLEADGFEVWIDIKNPSEK
jgi:hypothetical protein